MECTRCEKKVNKFFDVQLNQAPAKLCATCMEEQFPFTCSQCNKPIRQYTTDERKVTSNDGSQHWHSDCFVCAKCHVTLAGIPFYQDTDLGIMCMKCYEDKTADVCCECLAPIRKFTANEKSVSNVDGSKLWHEACFTCYQCAVNLVGRGYFAQGDGIYCDKCIEHVDV